MALTADRNTPRQEPGVRQQMMAAVKIFAGALVMRNSSGYLTKGAAATGLVGVGRAEEQVDNSGGSAGDRSVRVRPGVFRFDNSTSTDAITIAQIGKPCYAVDDSKVAKTDGGGARSIAGFVADVDELGVWVEFDESKVQTYLAGIALPVAG